MLGPSNLLRVTGMPSEAQTWRKVSAFWTPLGRKVGPAQGSHPYSGLYGDVVVSFYNPVKSISKLVEEVWGLSHWYIPSRRLTSPSVLRCPV